MGEDHAGGPGKAEDGAKIRLNRFLAQHGLGARRECDRLIESGGVAINGVKVDKLGVRVDPERDTVTFQGKRLEPVRPPEYLAYHKSRGALVTASDPQGRETIYDALRRSGRNCDHLKYVGRLDRNSEGLLLLTNDGALVHALTHPRFHVKKVYLVLIDKPLTEEDKQKMVGEGVMSDGQCLRAGAVRALSGREGYWYEVDLYEGKNRQVRRMFEGLKYSVERLKRVQFGVVKLGELKRGASRPLAEREVMGLLRLGHKVPGKPPR